MEVKQLAEGRKPGNDGGGKGTELIEGTQSVELARSN